MSNVVVSIAAARRFAGSTQPIAHLAGVLLPAEKPSDLEIVGPPVRDALVDGAYEGDLIEALAGALKPGDRVLVIGAGLGVVTTLIAQTGLAERIVAVEADPRLVAYQERVHALNEVDGIECLNGVLARRRPGPVPYFVRQDFRNSSLTPDAGACREVIVVPFVDLDLILAEERITLIVCKASQVALDLTAEIGLGSVERILISTGTAEASCQAGLVCLKPHRAAG